MFRNRWLEPKQKEEYEDLTASSGGAYEIVEEEVLETLGDDGNDNLALAGEVEVEIEEILEEQLRSQLPGISEGEDVTEVEYDERTVYDERSVYSEEFFGTSLTEVELDDSDLAAIYGQEYVDQTVRDDSEVEEVTFREDDDNLGLESLRISEATAPAELYDKKVDYDTDDSGGVDEDGVSCEECREAIDYILRQEKAVARMILTEEQAEQMSHLPLKVMKIIVDHMEQCDNADSPIDWDFLLKIVTPFCDKDGSEGDSDDDEEHKHAEGVFCSVVAER